MDCLSQAPAVSRVNDEFRPILLGEMTSGALAAPSLLSAILRKWEGCGPEAIVPTGYRPGRSMPIDCR